MYAKQAREQTDAHYTETVAGSKRLGGFIGAIKLEIGRLSHNGASGIDPFLFLSGIGKRLDDTERAIVMGWFTAKEFVCSDEKFTNDGDEDAWIGW